MAEISEQELKDMKLHEDKPLSGGVRILKVVGGWIYWKKLEPSQSQSQFLTLAGVFVPEP